MENPIEERDIRCTTQKENIGKKTKL